MLAKKTARARSQSSGINMNTVGIWVYTAGMVIAGILGGLGISNDYVNMLLLLVAVVVGFFVFDYEEVGQFGLRVLVLYFAKEGLGPVPAVGGFITGFFGGWVFFLWPIVLMLALRFFWHKRLAPLFS